MAKVRVGKGEALEKALRIFKKKLDREGTLKEMRAKKHYEKPSEKKKRKAKNARIGRR
ncbi:MAG: 30S ribosomal protein S21 [Candidatus Omnitrophica bacterium]|nr:30S ribosomal protein S21 [Candidatus Omnitrophota bacterium]